MNNNFNIIFKLHVDSKTIKSLLQDSYILIRIYRENSNVVILYISKIQKVMSQEQKELSRIYQYMKPF